MSDPFAENEAIQVDDTPTFAPNQAAGVAEFLAMTWVIPEKSVHALELGLVVSEYVEAMVHEVVSNMASKSPDPVETLPGSSRVPG